jgi:hypothetical protein
MLVIHPRTWLWIAWVRASDHRQAERISLPVVDIIVHVSTDWRPVWPSILLIEMALLLDIHCVTYRSNVPSMLPMGAQLLLRPGVSCAMIIVPGGAIGDLL